EGVALLRVAAKSPLVDLRVERRPILKTEVRDAQVGRRRPGLKAGAVEALAEVKILQPLANQLAPGGYLRADRGPGAQEEAKAPVWHPLVDVVDVLQKPERGPYPGRVRRSPHATTRDLCRVGSFLHSGRAARP